MTNILAEDLRSSSFSPLLQSICPNCIVITAPTIVWIGTAHIIHLNILVDLVKTAIINSGASMTVPYHLEDARFYSAVLVGRELLVARRAGQVPFGELVWGHFTGG